MIHLSKKFDWRKLITIFFLLTLIFLCSHRVLGYKTEERVELAPRIKLGVDRNLHSIPAWFIDGQDQANYLAVLRDKRLSFRLISEEGHIRRERIIETQSLGQGEFAVPLGETSDGAEYLVIFRQDNRIKPYMLTISSLGEEWVEMPFIPLRPKYVDGILTDMGYYFFYVQQAGNRSTLYLQRYYQEEWYEPRVVDSVSFYLGHPTIMMDEQGYIHLTWKGSRGNIGQQKYSRFDPRENEMVFDNLELGHAKFLFGGTRTRDDYYLEDIGARMALGPDENIFIVFTDSNWCRVFGILESEVCLVEVTAKGDVIKHEGITGRQGFSVFADILFLNGGALKLIWEDYVRRSFSLDYAYYDLEKNKLQSPANFTPFYGNHRLVSMNMNSQGDIYYIWREIGGLEDTSWFRTSTMAGEPAWHHRWGLWFLEAGAAGIVREVLFMSVYSFISSLAFVISNGPILIVLGILFYLLQKYNVLGRLSFFLVMAVCTGFLLVLKIGFPDLYGSPGDISGFVIFSAIFATAVVFALGQQHWNKPVEELTYIYYVALWMFVDSFISYLKIVPGIFSP